MRKQKGNVNRVASVTPESSEIQTPTNGGTGAVTPDRSGWTPRQAERRDFWNRIRAFPPDVARWRKRLLRDMVANPARFPLTEKLSPEQIQERLDSGISFLREVARILAVLYGTPDLGNKADATDELVYIILSRKTREGAYKQGFKALKERFRTWDDLLDAPRDEVEAGVPRWAFDQEGRESLRRSWNAEGDLRVVHAGSSPRVAGLQA